jgi:excisionase family DNA binding protein
MLMTLREVADYLRISTITLRRLVDGGKIKAVDLAQPGAYRRSLRIHKEELERFLKENTHGGL